MKQKVTEGGKRYLPGRDDRNGSKGWREKSINSMDRARRGDVFISIQTRFFPRKTKTREHYAIFLSDSDR